MNDSTLNAIIDKLHLKTFRQIYPHLQRTHPEVSKSQLRRVLKRRLKDPRLRQNKYYNPIFANHYGAWMTDLLENQDGWDPRYFMIFIHINSKYAEAYPTNSKSTDSILTILRDFVESHNVVSLTSDEEGALTSDRVREFLEDKKVSQRIVVEQQHTSLSTIDRFIRELRDMNIPTEKTHRESPNTKYRNFSVKRMNKLLRIYNNTVCSTGVTPKQMYENRDIEDRYIVSKLRAKHNVLNRDGYALRENDYVRYQLGKDPLKKRRYRWSRECYKIGGKEGNLFILKAADGTTMLMPRFRILLLGHEKPANIKFASTVVGSNNGVVLRILQYYKPQQKYKVVFDDGDGNEIEDIIPVRNMRERYPTMMSKLEREFFAAHPNVER